MGPSVPITAKTDASIIIPFLHSASSQVLCRSTNIARGANLDRNVNPDRPPTASGRKCREGGHNTRGNKMSIHMLKHKGTDSQPGASMTPTACRAGSVCFARMETRVSPDGLQPGGSSNHKK